MATTKWYKVGSCGECKKPIWSDEAPVAGGPPTGKTFASCRCEDIKKDPLNKPLPPPPKDPVVLACEMAGGHVITPRNWPVQLGPDPAKWNLQHEICPCIRCKVNIIVEGGVHKSITMDGRELGKDIRGVTVLVDDAEEAA